MSSAVTIGLPLIGDEYTMDAVTLGWVATSYLLAAAALLLPLGRVADIYGRRRVFLAGLVLHSLAALAAAWAPSAAALIAARAVQGIGGAMVFATGVAILVSLAPPARRGRLLGINVASVYLGLSIGPFAGGMLVQGIGWRSLFYAVALMGVVTFLFAAVVLKRDRGELRGTALSLSGAFVYSASLSALMLGFSFLPSAAGIACLAAGLGGLAAFIARERRARTPLLDVALLSHNRVFAFSNLAALINYAATFAVGFLLSLTLQYVFGLDPRDAGIVLVAQPAVMTVFSPLAGRLSDRVEPRILASIGMGVLAIGLAAFVFLTPDTPLWLVVALLAFIGLGFALFSSPNTNAVMSAVERSRYGVASSILGTMRLTGQMLSMGIVILVFATTVGQTRITAAQHPHLLEGVRLAFGIFALLSFAGIFASLVRGNVRDATSPRHH